jgi:sterol desaturase/sphingolipid hydroxylase (fatty acid hydroxylase superfamily)
MSFLAELLKTLTETLRSFSALAVVLYPPERLLGFGVVLVAATAAIVAQNRNPERYLRRPFRTDVLHALWFPVYAFLIAVPLTLQLSRLVTDYAPFLRLKLLSAEPIWSNVLVWLLLSDLSQYWLHRSLHRWRWLWTLHKVHHSQKELNPLTSWRVHWLEFVYLNVGAFAVSLLLGDFSGYHAIIIGILAASQMAQHSDLDWTYGPFGKIFVSPHFHNRHHSAAPEDLDVNFGTLLIVWDHLFGTARNSPGLASVHGLVGVEDDVPPSFLGQQLYPLSKYMRCSFPTFRARLRRVSVAAAWPTRGDGE